MKKLILLLSLNFAFLLMLRPSYGQQSPPIQWQKAIGGNNIEILGSACHTTDGGYMLGGESQSGISGDKTDTSKGGPDYWIVKTDNACNVQWQKTIGAFGDEEFHCIEQTSDGGYILAGESMSDSSGDKTENAIAWNDLWVVKTDSTGNIEWENTIGGNDFEAVHSIKQTSDGGYILAAYSDSDISGDKTENSVGNYDVWIIKLDINGSLQWQNTIAAGNSEYMIPILQTPDNGFLIGATSNSGIGFDKTIACIGVYDWWLLKLDSIGNIEWQKIYGGNLRDDLRSMCATVDGGYVLAGHSESGISGDKTDNSFGSDDYWVIKINSIGNIIWQKTIGGSGPDLLESIIPTSDGGYFMGGLSQSNISGNKTENCIGSTDYWVVKIDSVGNIQWDNTIGGDQFDIIQTVLQATDGGYVLAGYSNSGISGDKTDEGHGNFDYWIVKLYPDTTTGIKTIASSPLNIQTTPNPFTNELTVSIPQLNSEAQLSLLDVFGKQVLQQTIPTKTSNIKLQTLNVATGVYFLQLQIGKQTVTRKVVKM